MIQGVKTEKHHITFKHIRFGRLKKEGIAYLFDTFRYDHLFIATKESMVAVMECMDDPIKATLTKFDLVIGGYAIRQNEDIVAEVRFLSDMKFEYITGNEVIHPLMQFDIHMPMKSIPLPRPYKYRHSTWLEGTGKDIFHFLCYNRASPVEERGAHQLGESIHHPEKPLKILVEWLDSEQTPRFYASTLGLKFHLPS
jgi:hypothetical protein